MNSKFREAGRALEAALSTVREYESPMLSAEDWGELDKIARRVAERLAVLKRRSAEVGFRSRKLLSRNGSE